MLNDCFDDAEIIYCEDRKRPIWLLVALVSALTVLLALS